MDRLFASLARQTGAHLPFCFLESFLGLHSRAVCGLICFDNLDDEEPQIRISASRLVVVLNVLFQSMFRDGLFPEGDFNLVAPPRLDGPILMVQGIVGAICALPNSGLLKEPLEGGPLHRLIHQLFCILNLWELSHAGSHSSAWI